MFKRKADGPWYVRYADENGRRRTVSARTHKITEARAFLEDIRTRVRDRKAGISREVSSIRFDDLAKRWLASVGRFKRSAKADEYRLRLHLLPRFGTMLAHKVDEQQIALFSGAKLRLELEERTPGTLRAPTVNRCLQLLRTILRAGHDWGYLAKVPRFKLHREFPRERYLTKEEEERILAQANSPLRELVIVGINTGLRPGELLKLRWSKVDLESKTVLVVATKTDRNRRVPLNQAAIAALALLPTDRELVFGVRNNLVRNFTATVRRAGLETKGPDKVTAHVLRHTFASRLAARGVDMSTLKNLLGHSSLITLSRYVHGSSARAAVDLLDEDQANH